MPRRSTESWKVSNWDIKSLKTPFPSSTQQHFSRHATVPILIDKMSISIIMYTKIHMAIAPVEGVRIIPLCFQCASFHRMPILVAQFLQEYDAV